MAGKTLPSSSGYFNKAMLNILESDTPKTESKNMGKNTGNNPGKSTNKNTSRKK